MSTMITDPNLIRLARLQALKHGLRLEIKGLRFSKGSVCTIVRKELGFKGNRKKILEQLEAYISIKEQEAGL